MIPERDLWCAVLSMALLDTLRSGPEGDEARAWVDGGGRDFRRVCSLVGVEPSVVRANRRAIALRLRGKTSGPRPKVRRFRLQSRDMTA